MAVGWNFGESLLTRFLDFYVNAKSMQFDWKHIITAIEANLSLVSFLFKFFIFYLIANISSYLSYKQSQFALSFGPGPEEARELFH